MQINSSRMAQTPFGPAQGALRPGPLAFVLRTDDAKLEGDDRAYLIEWSVLLTTSMTKLQGTPRALQRQGRADDAAYAALVDSLTSDWVAR